jgi:phospholipase/carboxylesterase
LNVTITGGSDREGGGDGPVVVLMHGYGAPGDDLVGLYRVLGVPREVRFVFPEAPLSPPELAAFGGRAWWPIDMAALQLAQAQGRQREQSRTAPPGLAAAREQLNTLLDELVRELGVSSEQVILGGFSQGSMLACDVVLRGTRPFAGMALLSSTLLCRDEWLPLMAARKGLPVLLTHGETDGILPYAGAIELRDALKSAGLDVTWVSFRGGHELPSSVLDALTAFAPRCYNPRGGCACASASASGSAGTSGSATPAASSRPRSAWASRSPCCSACCRWRCAGRSPCSPTCCFPGSRSAA